VAEREDPCVQDPCVIRVRMHGGSLQHVGVHRKHLVMSWNFPLCLVMVVCQTAIGDIIINNKSKTQIKRGTKLIDSAQQNSQFSEKVNL
jgi:hypothetical protein